MRELQRTDRLLIATVIFVVIIIIGFLTMREPDIKYDRDFLAAAADAQNPQKAITPEAMVLILNENAPSQVLVDVRNIYDFDRGHLPNAIQIPKPDLLEEGNLELFKDFQKEQKEVILYGKDQLDAQGAAILLRDIGFGNVRVLMGGYDYMQKMLKQDIEATDDAYLNEKPRYDYAEMTSSQNTEGVQTKDVKAPEVVLPARKTKSSHVEGGC